MICYILFRNSYFHNFVSTLTNVVKLDVENDNVVSTLSNVVHINVKIHNIDSTLFDIVNSNAETYNIVSTSICRCAASRRCINQKTTLKQRWNVCWVVAVLSFISLAIFCLATEHFSNVWYVFFWIWPFSLFSLKRWCFLCLYWRIMENECQEKPRISSFVDSV